MKYSNQSYNLRIELDTKNCELSEGEISQLEKTLSPLREPVKNFPVTALFVTIEFEPRSQAYRVKAALRLPGRTFATGDVDAQWHPAFRRSVRKLVQRVTGYKEAMDGSEAIAKHEKGTRHDVVAEQEIDPRAVDKAVERQDYAEFRTLTYPFEEPLRQRIGRWIQRYPEFEAQIGDRFELADLVEEVFLNAFERYDDHPREVPFGDWLEHLIDPSVKLMSRATDEELENISFARSAIEARSGS